LQHFKFHQRYCNEFTKQLFHSSLAWMCQLSVSTDVMSASLFSVFCLFR